MIGVTETASYLELQGKIWTLNLHNKNVIRVEPLISMFCLVDSGSELYETLAFVWVSGEGGDVEYAYNSWALFVFTVKIIF